MSDINYFAVELFNPFDVNIPMEDFQLVVTDYNEPVNPEIITSKGVPSGHFFIIFTKINTPFSIFIY